MLGEECKTLPFYEWVENLHQYFVKRYGEIKDSCIMGEKGIELKERMYVAQVPGPSPNFAREVPKTAHHVRDPYRTPKKENGLCLGKRVISQRKDRWSKAVTAPC